MAGQRERARQAVLDDITAEGRRQLARDGAAGLSLRSVARELDMVSSAIYRYVASRDALLTLLIVAGYDRLGAALERAGAARDARERWRATCGALRAWASGQPSRVRPALRLARPRLRRPAGHDRSRHPGLRRAGRCHCGTPPALADRPSVTGALAADGERIADGLGLTLPPGQGVALLGAWATLFGLVSLELFGHTHNVVTDHDAFFAHHVDALADDLGL